MFVFVFVLPVPVLPVPVLKQSMRQLCVAGLNFWRACQLWVATASSSASTSLQSAPVTQLDGHSYWGLPQSSP